MTDHYPWLIRLPDAALNHRCEAVIDDILIAIRFEPLEHAWFVAVLPNTTQDQLNAFRCGEFIQHAFPHLNADQREFVLTGMTPESWDQMFPIK